MFNFLTKRKLQKQTKDFEAGFSWGMIQFYLTNKTIADLQYWVGLKPYDTFNRGCRAALQILEEQETIKTSTTEFFILQDIWDWCKETKELVPLKTKRVLNHLMYRIKDYV